MRDRKINKSTFATPATLKPGRSYFIVLYGKDKDKSKRAAWNGEHFCIGSNFFMDIVQPEEVFLIFLPEINEYVYFDYRTPAARIYDDIYVKQQKGIWDIGNILNGNTENVDLQVATTLAENIYSYVLSLLEKEFESEIRPHLKIKEKMKRHE